MSRIARDTHTPSEQLLWVNVLRQAVEDALAPPKTTDPTRLDAVNAAREWLFKPNRDFFHVCDLAGAEPSRVRSAARAMIVEADKRRAVKAKANPGVVRNFDRGPATGPGSVARDRAELEFFK